MIADFRFYAHQFLWTAHWSDASLPLLDTARSLGLQGMEISLGDDIAFDAVPLRNRAAELQMELTVGPGNVWPMECDISADDPAQRELGMNWHRGIIERATDIGAVAYCGAIYGHPGRVLRRRPPAGEWPRTAANLHALAEFAGKRGVKLVIEPMSRFRTHLVNTAVQAMEMIHAAGHANLFVNLDTYHMITEERDYAAAIRRAAPRLFGLHACENDRGVPGGGLVPWHSVCTALRETHLPVRIMFETYNSAGDFGLSRGIFRNVCPDGSAFVRAGLKFIRPLITNRKVV